MDEAHVAFGAEIGLGILRIEQPLLGGLDRRENRSRAIGRAIDTHAQIDLVRARIGIVQLDQRKQCIGGLGSKIFEHGVCPESCGKRGGSMPPLCLRGNP
jgi:hypothetical protein